MHESEKKFADMLEKNGVEYIYQPCVFRFNGKNYRPDFYTIKDGMFYEVVTTDSAYSYHKKDIEKMKMIFHALRFKVVTPTGEEYICGETVYGKKKTYTNYPIIVSMEVYKEIRHISFSLSTSFSKTADISIRTFVDKYDGKPMRKPNINKKRTGICLDNQLKDKLKSISMKLSERVGYIVCINDIIWFCLSEYAKSYKRL